MELQNIFFAILLFSAEEFLDLFFEKYEQDSQNDLRRIKKYEYMPKAADSYRRQKNKRDKNFLPRIY